MQKKNDVLQAGLARFAEKLDQQWCFAQNDLAARCAVADVAVTGGKREQTAFECAYEGMCVGFVALGGEWKRDAAGRHWVYLAGLSATAEGVGK